MVLVVQAKKMGLVLKPGKPFLQEFPYADCNVPTDVGLGHVLHPRVEGGAHPDAMD